MAPSTRIKKIKPYKDYLTPALHRRFLTGLATLTLVCYLEAIFVGSWNHAFWSWFPLGRVGIRTGLFFLPGLSIFVLRISQLHAGLRNSVSGVHTLLKYGPRWQTLHTAGWYCFSAWLFSEIYIWSVPEDLDLYRIKSAAKSGRPILNEKPIYLTSFLYFLAIVQTACHIYFDYDRLSLPAIKVPAPGSTGHKAAVELGPRAQLKHRLGGMVASALKRTIITAVVSPLVYSVNWPIIPFIFHFRVRSFAWSFTRTFATIFWKLPKSGALPAHVPFHLSVVLRTIIAGFLLTMIWEFANAAFSAYVTQEPLKNGRPITYESRDPNGSLLTGLNGKQLHTRIFAFWELVYIARQFEGRRRAIYEDIDRKDVSAKDGSIIDQSAWTQICDICLEVVDGISLRIRDYDPAKPPGEFDVSDRKLVPEACSLPRIAQGVRDVGDKVFAESPPPASTSEKFAKSMMAVGQLSLTKQDMRRTQLLKERERIEREAASANPSPRTLLIQNWIKQALVYQIFAPFRQDYRRVLACVALGAPYGDVGIIVDAIDSLTRFAVNSLTEDKYGNVQRDVKVIVLSFTRTVTELETFRETLPNHWTDVDMDRESPEVDAIMSALKAGLRDLITAFGNYYGDLGMTQGEMREARQAASSP